MYQSSRIIGTCSRGWALSGSVVTMMIHSDCTVRLRATWRVRGLQSDWRGITDVWRCHIVREGGRLQMMAPIVTLI